MDFLTLGTIFCIIVAILFIGWLVEFFKSKGIVNEDVLDTSEQVLNIANAILSNFQFETDVQDKIKLITSIVNITIQYADHVVSGDDRKKVTYDATLQVLKELKVTVDDNLKLAIDFSIEKAIDALAKK